MNKLIFLFLSIFLFANCSKTKKAPCGVEYKVVESKHGQPLNAGDIIQIIFNCSTEYDSIIASSLSVKKPLMLQIHSLKEGGSEINEVLNELSVGDSVEIYPNAFEFISKTLKQNELPKKLNVNSKLKLNIRIVKIMNAEEMADMKRKETAQLIEKERLVLEEYVQREKIQSFRLPSGMYFIEIQKGSTMLIDKTTNVKLNYKGYFINGLEFGSSERDGRLLEITLSKNKVIDGWEEALLKMGVGSRVKLVIPSKLAYGELGLQGLVPPYTTLIFEITVVSVN